MARLSLSKPSTHRSPLAWSRQMGTALLRSFLLAPSFGSAAGHAETENFPRRLRGGQSVKRAAAGQPPPCPAARPSAAGLAAGHVHVAGEGRALMAPVDDEIVALGLARDRLGDRGIEEIVAFGCAQRSAQIGGVFL